MTQENNIQPVDLSEWTQVSNRVASHSYVSPDGKRMMKFAFPNEGQLELVQKEERTAIAVRNLGISTPQVLGLVKSMEGYVGIMYENIADKESLARGISNHPEDYKKYLCQYAKMMQVVHATQCNTQEFTYIVDEIRSAVDSLDLLSDFQKQRVLEYLDTIPKVTTCLHGDGHLGNIITAPSGDYIIDIQAFTYGSPLFDEALFFYFLLFVEDEGLANVMHFSRETAKACWEYWCYDIKGFSTSEEKASYEATLKKYAFCMCIKHAAHTPKGAALIASLVDECGLFD